MKKEINDVIIDFVENMNALKESTPLVLSILSLLASKLSEAHGDYLEKYCNIKDQNENNKTYAVPIERHKRVISLRNQSLSLKKSSELIPRNFLVSFVSEYDCFLSVLLRVIYTKKPELLNDSSRQMSFTELINFDSIDDAKEYVLEKEIETILRQSHIEHFEIFEKKFNVKLKPSKSIWAEFVEITERRNLLVHSNGIVSSQYLRIYEKYNSKPHNISVGDKLNVDSTYLFRAYEVFFEITVKLAQVLWRKLFPAELKSADESLNDLCYNLISEHKIELASNLLEFALELPRHHDESTKRVFAINLAQCFKRTKDEVKYKEVLNKFDWSACDYRFKLAISVLNEQYEEAANLLETTIKAGNLSEQEVLEWPLFKQFRKTNYFLQKYNELFEKDYAQQEESINKEFLNHMNSIFSNREILETEEVIKEQPAIEAVATEIGNELDTNNEF